MRRLPPSVLFSCLVACAPSPLAWCAEEAPVASATPAPTAGLAEATAALQSGNAAKARGILDALVQREPANAKAWRMLGSVALQLADAAAARTAFESALKIEPEAPQALVGMAQVHVAERKPDAAFDWLAKARATRRYDTSQLPYDPLLAAIAKDPRMAALMPTPSDFRDPFVEPTTLLREWPGEAVNDQFGWIARGIGDVDGDGAPDFVTSAPTRTVGGANAGRVYVYSTKSGKLLWSADGKPGDQLGTGLESAGDGNCDGVPDVVAGGPGGDVAFLYSGADGKVLHAFAPRTKGNQFGQHASGIGDFDGDGCTDVAIGAPGPQGPPAAGAKAPPAGYVYVYSGKTGKRLALLTGERAGDGYGSSVTGAVVGKHRFIVVGAGRGGPANTGRVYVYRDLGGKPAFVIEADGTGAALGAMFVAVPGDTDGDGVPDIYASDWSNAAKGRSTGRVYVHSGATGKRLLTLTGETEGEGFGTTHARTGDVDGDGHDDLIVGSWQYAGAALSGGRATLVSGRDGKVLATYTCRTPGDTFGFDAVGLGDTDGDGTVDFLVTSAWSAVSGFHSGRVLLISSGIKRAGS